MKGRTVLEEVNTVKSFLLPRCSQLVLPLFQNNTKFTKNSVKLLSTVIIISRSITERGKVLVGK